MLFIAERFFYFLGWPDLMTAYPTRVQVGLFQALRLLLMEGSSTVHQSFRTLSTMPLTV